MKKPLLHKPGLLKIALEQSLLRFSQIFSSIFLLLNHKGVNEKFNAMPNVKTEWTVLKFYDTKAYLIPIPSQSLLG